MKRIFSLVMIACIFLISCNDKPAYDHAKNELEAKLVLQTLLTSIENRDLETLKTTLSPYGNMQLINPATPITNTVDDFVTLHENWFKNNNWTIKTSILDFKAGPNIAMATTDALYREPERNGAPYFNRLIVSYVLEKIEGKWYIIKDHACSIQKSTDKQTE